MNYLKERYRVIFTVLMIYLIFFIAFFLYSLPLYAIIYPVLLSLFLLSVIIFFDYLKLKKKHQQLKEKQLYQVNSQIENDYINIINQLKEEKQKLALNEQNKYQDMIDYYTTWVHQIKTPIASMKLTLDKEDGITARKLNKDLTAIESYVEMVLAYLRLDCSSNDLLIQEVKLDEAIRNAVKHFSSDFIHKKIRIEIINCEQRVLSDEKWLSFIIEQLLSNALKYTDKGKIVFSFKDNTLKIEIPFVVIITIILCLMGYFFNEISRLSALILIILFIAFLGYLYWLSKKGVDSVEEVEELSEKDTYLRLLALIVIGAVMIVVGSNLTVDAAKEIAKIFGISDRIIGLTIVAFGTSLPELVTSVTAARKGKTDIAIGNIVGSNIFNILFVLGISGLVSPSPIFFDSAFLSDGVIATIAAVLLFVLSYNKKSLNRMGGIILLAGYIIYIVKMMI